MLALHIPCGLTCVLAGLVAIVSKKKAGRHPTFGTIYYWSLAVVFASASVMAILYWAEFRHLFILGLLSFATATFGRTARRQRWHGWVRWHISGMGLSYILMLTAFYVDNGKNLPLWRELPTIAFWVLPSIIGLPFLARALFFHPLAVQARKGPIQEGP
jgi:hypothetical protein